MFDLSCSLDVGVVYCLLLAVCVSVCRGSLLRVGVRGCCLFFVVCCLSFSVCCCLLVSSLLLCVVGFCRLFVVWFLIVLCC